MWIRVRSVGIVSKSSGSRERKKPVAIGSSPSLWPSVIIVVTPGQREVERRDLVPEVAHERQDEAAERRVDVERQTAAHGKVGERLDRIDEPEAAGRRDRDQADGVRA